MGDPAGEPSHRLHLLRLAHLLLGLDACRDIASDADDARDDPLRIAEGREGVEHMAEAAGGTENPLVGDGLARQRSKVGALVHRSVTGPRISRVVRPMNSSGRNPSRSSQRPKMSTHRCSVSSWKTTSSIDSTRLRKRRFASWASAVSCAVTTGVLAARRTVTSRAQAMMPPGIGVRRTENHRLSGAKNDSNSTSPCSTTARKASAWKREPRVPE